MVYSMYGFLLHGIIQMKNVCLIDLDDTLGDFSTGMLEALNHRTGKYFTYIPTFDVVSVYGITDDDLFNICREEQVAENTIASPDAIGFLNELHNRGWCSVVITARGWHPHAEEITAKWLSDNNLTPDELIVVGENQSKTDVIGKFDNIILSLDDRIKNCREYTKSGLVDNVIIYEASWNNYMSRWNTDWNGWDYHFRVKSLFDVFDLQLNGDMQCTEQKLIKVG